MKSVYYQHKLLRRYLYVKGQYFIYPQPIQHFNHIIHVR